MQNNQTKTLTKHQTNQTQKNTKYRPHGNNTNKNKTKRLLFITNYL